MVRRSEFKNVERLLMGKSISDFPFLLASLTLRSVSVPVLGNPAPMTCNLCCLVVASAIL